MDYRAIVYISAKFSYNTSRKQALQYVILTNSLSILKNLDKTENITDITKLMRTWNNIYSSKHGNKYYFYLDTGS